MNRALVLLFILVFLGGAVSAAYSVSYQIHDLGIVGDAFAVNNKGQIVGTSGAYAFLWENYKSQNVFGGNAHDINDAGQIVGYRAGHAALWEGGVTHDLGATGDKWSTAMAINEAGQTVGYLYPNVQHAVLWEGTAMEDLGTLGGYYSDAKGINNLGEVVGQSRPTSGSLDHAYILRDGEMQDLGTLKKGYSVARSINDNGQVVGESDGHAFLWEDGAMRDLGTLPGQSLSYAYGINKYGDVAGFSIPYDGRYQNAVLWTHGTMIDLGSLGGGWSAAYAINDSGWIVGSSRDSKGQYRVTLWTPVPEPSSAASFLGLVAGLVGIVRRRRI